MTPRKLSKISEVETPGTAALSDKASAGGGLLGLIRLRLWRLGFQGLGFEG